MGEAVSRGLPDLEDMPLNRFVAFMWWYCTTEREEKDVTKFKNRLWQPPKGEVPTDNSPWAADAETSAFKSLQSTVAPKG